MGMPSTVHEGHLALQRLHTLTTYVGAGVTDTRPAVKLRRPRTMVGGDRDAVPAGVVWYGVVD